ncbi:MAG TPA: glycosyltransferase family 4 protein [Rhabdochlamydiaceae bacterium]|nr:glycosyltransferase family 4 protein [Rhabdochlamydiaceae bacterium]
MTKQITILKKNLSGRGGLENQTFQIAQAFQKRGFTVTCLTSGSIHPDFQRSSLHFHAFSLKSKINFLKVHEFDRQCQNYLKANPCDLVFGMERNRFQTHLRLGNGIHRAYLHHLSQFETSWQRFSHLFNPGHYTFLNFEKTALEHPNLKVVIANSAMVQKEIQHYYKVDPSKIHLLHNGVDWHGMAQDFEEWEEKRHSEMERRGLDPSKFQFLFVGHNYGRKGLPFLLKAWPQLKECQLSVVGQDRNLPYYRALAKNLKDVFFFGPQEKVRPFYQIADALLIPSIYDPFSNATLEALGMGLFVVSSKTNGGHEVLNEGNGTVIEALQSTDAIIAALQRALEKKKSFVSAQKIRSSISHLDFSHQLEQLIKICTP